MPTPCRVDITQDAAYVCRKAALLEASGQNRVGLQFAGGVQLPDLPTIVGSQKLRRETAEISSHICNGPRKHARSIVVAGGINRLRQELAQLPAHVAPLPARLVAGELERHLPSPDILTAEQRAGDPESYTSHGSTRSPTAASRSSPSSGARDR